MPKYVIFFLLILPPPQPKFNPKTSGQIVILYIKENLLIKVY